MKVKIPFKPRFKEPMLNGTKTWTSRTKCYGKVGDTFEAFGYEFEIRKVTRRHLEWVADHWKEEGFTSKLEFIQFWIKLHARKGFLPIQLVYVHIFKLNTLRVCSRRHVSTSNTLPKQVKTC